MQKNGKNGKNITQITSFLKIGNNRQSEREIFEFCVITFELIKI